MGRRSESEVNPRNGMVLEVIIVARISGCADQTELSLDDQEDHGRTVTGEYYSGPAEFRVIATIGKGERLDRPELAELEELLRTRTFDLLIFEDVGRLVRGAAAHRLCGIAVDHGTRVLSPNDFLDTADENWEEVVLDACKEHMKHNAHTSRRLKHKLKNRFLKFGGATARPIFGYIVASDAETYFDWRKDEAAEHWIKEGFRILRNTLNGEAVAEFFNENGVPTGRYCRNKKWDGRMVLRFYRNSLLIGKPGRGFRHTIKLNEQGRRISVPNPKGPEYRDEPHLAFLNSEEWETWKTDMERHHATCRRKCNNGIDSRSHVPKKRTRPLGQHARCWYCGREYVWGANGQTDFLQCSASRNWNCWNSIGVNGPFAAKTVVKALVDKLTRVDGVAEQFGELLRAAQKSTCGTERARVDLQRKQTELDRDKSNLKAAILQSGSQPLLNELLSDLDRRERDLAVAWRSLDKQRLKTPNVPRSVEQLRTFLGDELNRLAINSCELTDLLRLLLPDVYIYLVRLCDGGHLLPRAKVRFSLLGSFPDSALVPGLRELLSEEMTLDLFDTPDREKIRAECTRLAVEGLGPKAIATRLKGNPSPTHVANALHLDARMHSMGLTTPYVLVDEPPDDYPKLRRHKNRKYCFTAVEGYERPTR